MSRAAMLGNLFWKCKMPYILRVRLLVGWLVDRVAGRSVVWMVWHNFQYVLMQFTLVAGRSVVWMVWHNFLYVLMQFTLVLSKKNPIHIQKEV